jgi:hypothetical protein
MKSFRSSLGPLIGLLPLAAHAASISEMPLDPGAAVIIQGDAPAVQALIEQQPDAAGDFRAFINQIGTGTADAPDHIASIRQSGTGTGLAYLIQSDGKQRASIDQVNDGARIDGSLSVDALNQILVSELGDNDSGLRSQLAVINQEAVVAGATSTATVTQEGRNRLGVIAQTALSADATLEQRGEDNNAFIAQEYSYMVSPPLGGTALATVQQLGVDQFTYVTQTENADAITQVIQVDSSGSRAETRQQDSGVVSLSVEQRGGSDHVADVSQINDTQASKITLLQSGGVAAQATLSQSATAEGDIQVTQDGVMDSVVTVVQESGARMQAEIQQINVLGGVATVMQVDSPDAFARVMQADAVGAVSLIGQTHAPGARAEIVVTGR